MFRLGRNVTIMVCATLPHALPRACPATPIRRIVLQMSDLCVQLCVRALVLGLPNMKTHMPYISNGKTCPMLCPRVWCFAWCDSSDARFLCPTLCPSSLYWNRHIKPRMDTKSASGYYKTINRGGKCPGPPAVRSSIVVLHLSRGGS